jgi:hypothetical protein
LTDGTKLSTALGEFIAEEYKAMDAGLYPDPDERLMIAMSSTVNIIVKTARRLFERQGMSEADAHARAIEMIGYAVGEDALFHPTAASGGVA